MSYNDSDEEESATRTRKERRGASDGSDAAQEPFPGETPGNRKEGGGGPVEEEAEEVDRPRKVGRQEAARIALLETIDKTLKANPPDGVWDTASCAYTVIQTLKQEDADRWTVIQAHLVLDVVTGLVQRRITREIKTEARADARQGILALPGFELVKPWVRLEHGIAPLSKVTVKQHRDSVKDRATYIKHMEYPRWSEERMKREKDALAQERKLDRKIKPVTAGNEEMEMGQAMELFLESPALQQRRKAIKSRWERRKAKAERD